MPKLDHINPIMYIYACIIIYVCNVYILDIDSFGTFRCTRSISVHSTGVYTFRCVYIPLCTHFAVLTFAEAVSLVVVTGVIYQRHLGDLQTRND